MVFRQPIPRCTGIGTGSVPVLQVSNFSIPISVSVLDFEAISCPYSLRLLETKNLPVPFPHPVLYFSEFFRTLYFMSQFFLVPVPVLRTRTPYPYLNQYQSMLVKAVIIANLTKG